MTKERNDYFEDEVDVYGPELEELDGEYDEGVMMSKVYIQEILTRIFSIPVADNLPERWNCKNENELKKNIKIVGLEYEKWKNEQLVAILVYAGNKLLEDERCMLENKLRIINNSCCFIKNEKFEINMCVVGEYDEGDYDE